MSELTHNVAPDYNDPEVQKALQKRLAKQMVIKLAVGTAIAVGVHYATALIVAGIDKLTNKHEDSEEE